MKTSFKSVPTLPFITCVEAVLLVLGLAADVDPQGAVELLVGRRNG